MSQTLTPKHLKSLKRRKDVQRVMNYVKNFMTDYGLNPIPREKCFLGASAGPDSQFLWVCLELLQIDFIPLHFIHGIRAEGEQEAAFLQQQSHELQRTLHIGNAVGLGKKTANLEAQARKQRLNFFRQYDQGRKNLYLGHHIDDSFEWSLFKRLSSSKAESSLGIPVRSKNVRRPLHCFTKAQILGLLKAWQVPYFLDKSNQDNQYERGFLRSQVIPKIQKRYPQYLKHFALSHNELAKKLGKSAWQKKTDFEQTVFLGENHALVDASYGLDLAQLRGLIERFSNTQRGQLSEQLIKFSKAIYNHKKGPFSFSGGVKAYFYGTEALILSTKAQEDFAKLDEDLVKKIKKSQIPEGRLNTLLPKRALKIKSDFYFHLTKKLSELFLL